MPLSKRYLEEISYKNPDSETWILDSQGNKTGEKTISYSTEKTTKAFVSADSGRAKIGNFGYETNYDKTLMIADKNCDIEVGAVVTYNGGKYIVKVIGWAKCLSYLPVGLDEAL